MVTRIIYFLIIILVFAGCKKLDPTPEAKDQIYLDLLAQAEKAAKDLQAKEKELAANKLKYENASDDSYEKKLLRSDIFDNERAIDKLKQMEKYYQLSAESRQIYDRKESLEYYRRGKAWDPRASSDLYFKEKELAAQPREWRRGLASEINSGEKKKPNKKE